MNKEMLQEDLSSLISPLIGLANEIDGAADFGMTVCFIKEEEIAGRHNYIGQRCEKIRCLADSIVSAMNEVTRLHSKDLSALQAELVAGADLLLNAFRALERFRSLSPESVRFATEAVRTGWETVHRVIREIADTLDPIDQSWYLPILERQDSYRTQLGQVCSCFNEEAITRPVQKL